MRERVFGFLRFAPAQIKEADVGAPAAIGRNWILSRPSLGPSAFGPADPAAIGVRPKLFAEGERLDLRGRQQTERRVFGCFIDNVYFTNT
jgi:hypothetical protein